MVSSDMQEDGDRETPTPRVCDACGGAPADCRWCSGGYQTLQQQRAWQMFRNRMRTISGTYSLLEGLVNQLIGRLRERGSDEANILADEGKDLLITWWASDADSDERKETAARMSAFQRRALDVLSR